MRKSALAIAFLCVLMTGCPKRAAAQVAVSLGAAPIATFLDNAGRPLSGGKVYTYQAGTNNQQATYKDALGSTLNTNPIILNSAGRANIYYQALGYKLVVFNSSNVQLYSVDGYVIPPFLNGNNSFSGNNTFSGTNTFNGAATFSAGGSISGTFSGSPTFSGNINFGGTPTFSGVPVFSGGIKTDAISGTLTNGGIFNYLGAQGTGTNTGENLVFAAGAGPSGNSAAGGYVRVAAGNGGSTGGAGGSASVYGGNAVSGNSNGGDFGVQGGLGSGTGGGGLAVLTAGAGGSTSGAGGYVLLTAGPGGTGGNGGDVKFATGAKGAGGQDGSIIISGSGRTKYSVAGTAVSPGCTATGMGAGASCIVSLYSTDSDGALFMTAGAGAAALGTITITFNQSMGANNSLCTFTLMNNGATVWDPRATLFANSFTPATAVANWDNNAVALTNTSAYRLTYHCVGRI